MPRAAKTTDDVETQLDAAALRPEGPSGRCEEARPRRVQRGGRPSHGSAETGGSPRDRRHGHRPREKAEEAIDQAEEWATDNMATLRDAVREESIKAVAIAAGIGALFGLLFFRR